MVNFQETLKIYFKSSYLFLLCGHLHKDTTLGCKYSVMYTLGEKWLIFSKISIFPLYEVASYKFLRGFDQC